MTNLTLINKDCLQAMKELAENSVDSIVTDPPYGISLLGKGWDYEVPSIEVWRECLRVLKPGGYLLSFSSARTYHRIAVGIEDAGAEIRDQIMWVYGSGFPKSQNMGKKDPTLEGWGTALKPAHEPIVVARKPLSESTALKNMQKLGTGGLNIADSMVGPRYPANLIHDGSDIITDAFPEKAGALFSANRQVHQDGGTGHSLMGSVGEVGSSNGALDEPGSAARFFYCAKPTKNERKGNAHPTQKPLKLMKYLVRLVTMEAGTVLDPFMGSGSTGVAALEEGYRFIGIEREKDYYEICESRMKVGTLPL